ncbi:hypothetical protein HanXRQr2_Chr09g0401711 [Helianthus annuus]|uniref:Uncharacterized protein n=1 Tax=Helianthus annuus TaxID=4232 RepID=A0A9K3I8W7_HELAN|nr:hypothetical protein HanXRQr2_Chr09g0401711 [Helianthus annuus]KAJ0527040.1 hypothetical protein HanHA300_Chr09g0329751 [Helianthus annuus]KAJ0543440.1 hypothetical protein HanHA89_Chr09g0350701 [Helianthus annuus]KAJ0708497.1 hypothetical protein HanLR1_Chr09g0330051 [Helianthus annuus]KAJ0712415.1 hypothetical protein HanOQP8_Chr09g0334571 [Helianthus annuus]
MSSKRHSIYATFLCNLRGTAHFNSCLQLASFSPLPTPTLMIERETQASEGNQRLHRRS